MDASEVECPICESKPGERCVEWHSGIDYFTAQHPARQEYADEQQELIDDGMCISCGVGDWERYVQQGQIVTICSNCDYVDVN